MAHLSGLDFKGADHPRLTCVQLRKTVNSLKDSFLRCPPLSVPILGPYLLIWRLQQNKNLDSLIQTPERH